MIKVSVIIPIYNVEEYLESCLESVARQTLENIQVIMVDDGSPDSSCEIAKRYAEKYEHFEYVYQENGGLGNARNTGVKHAKGKYLIFLDSDDIVPPEAYEKMYKSAEKYQSDMVVGNVIRFNTRGELHSVIHSFAFEKIVEGKTHITTNTNLIFDTGAWNKLIRKDFWDREKFTFPEGMLYEDIPVTIPLHYQANHVSVVYDVCYMWRSRDGASKSITQMMSDERNLEDRLKALRIVDLFFKEKNITNEELIYKKHFKWLRVDLNLFINSMRYQDHDTIKKRAQMMQSYIEEVIPKHMIDELPEIFRHKYYYLMRGEYDKLIQLIEFEYLGYRNIKIKKRGAKYYAKFPQKIMPGNIGDMKITVKYERLRQAMCRIQEENGRYIIEGYIYRPGLSLPFKSNQSLKAYLVQLETNKKIPIKIRNRYVLKNSGLLLSRKYKQLNMINYSGSGYHIEIRQQEDILEQQLSGEFKILLEVERDGWKDQVFLSGTDREAKNNNSISTVLGDDIINLEVIEMKVLKIQVQRMKYLVQETQFLKNDLQMTLNQVVQDYYYKNLDGILKKADVSVHEQGITIPYENISEERTELGVLEGNRFIPLHSKTRFSRIQEMDHLLILERTLEHYHYCLKAIPNQISTIHKFQQSGTVTTLEVSRGNMELGEVTGCYLFFNDALVEGPTVLAKGTIEKQGSLLISKFSIHLKNQEITKNLYGGERKIYICYQGKTDIIDAISGMDRPYCSVVKTSTRIHQLMVDVNDILILQTILRKGFFDRTKKKQKLLAALVYPIFRKLPIKKKTIVFESMWGEKFNCNPRSIYEYVQKEHPDYTCVWSLNDDCIPITGTGIRVRKLSIKYLYYMARTKYFVNNVNFHSCIVKRRDQVEVQTMHGTPLKTMGTSVKGELIDPQARKDFFNKCKRWDFLVVQNDFTAELSKSVYAFDRETMYTGYPRTDVLFQKNNAKDICKIKEKFDLPMDKKVILYAPTWRVRNKFELMLDIEKFRAQLSGEYVLIVRIHHFALKEWKELPRDGFVYDFSRIGAIEDFYLITDILITDYSSVMFDFSILDRPMLFFTYDIDLYGDNRGFNVDFRSEAPGELVFTSDELLHAILNIDAMVEKNQDKICAFQKKFVHYECENSSKKVFERMIEKI